MTLQDELRNGHAALHLEDARPVIDPDYRGEIKAILVNHGAGIFQVKRGMAVAQLILERHVITDEVVQVDKLPTTTRGSSGFGSTDLSYLSTIYEDEEDELDTGAGTIGDGAGSEVPPH